MSDVETIRRGALAEIAFTRAEAIRLGLSTYCTGKPCPSGHIAARYVANWTCVICNTEKIGPWRGANKAKVNADSRRWNKENYARARTNTKKWRKANPDKVRTIDANKKASRRLAEGTFTQRDIQALRGRQKGKCAHSWCRKSLSVGYHVDHIMPLARGGTNWPANLQLLCPHCNMSKHARHPIDVAQEHGLLL